MRCSMQLHEPASSPGCGCTHPSSAGRYAAGTLCGVRRSPPAAPAVRDASLLQQRSTHVRAGRGPTCAYARWYVVSACGEPGPSRPQMERLHTLHQGGVPTGGFGHRGFRAHSSGGVSGGMARHVGSTRPRSGGGAPPGGGPGCKP